MHQKLSMFSSDEVICCVGSLFGDIVLLHDEVPRSEI